MKYIVTARNWNEELEAQFGEQNPYLPFGEETIHDLTDSDVIQAIIQHGRASINRQTRDEKEILELRFENDYD